jgi:hypothetical protein
MIVVDRSFRAHEVRAIPRVVHDDAGVLCPQLGDPRRLVHPPPGHGSRRLARPPRVRLSASFAQQFDQFRPKGLCMCTPGLSPVVDNLAGFLVRDAGGKIACAVPSFNAAGELSGFASCFVFQMLAK